MRRTERPQVKLLTYVVICKLCVFKSGNLSFHRHLFSLFCASHHFNVLLIKQIYEELINIIFLVLNLIFFNIYAILLKREICHKFLKRQITFAYKKYNRDVFAHSYYTSRMHW